MTRLSDKRAALEKRAANTQPEEIDVFLVTHRKTTVHINAKTGVAETNVSREGKVEYERKDVKRMLIMRDKGDSRLRDTRAFKLRIDKDGEPHLGDELRAADDMDDDDD